MIAHLSPAFIAQAAVPPTPPVAFIFTAMTVTLNSNQYAASFFIGAAISTGFDWNIQYTFTVCRKYTDGSIGSPIATVTLENVGEQVGAETMADGPPPDGDYVIYATAQRIGFTEAAAVQHNFQIIGGETYFLGGGQVHPLLPYNVSVTYQVGRTLKISYSATDASYTNDQVSVSFREVGGAYPTMGFSNEHAMQNTWYLSADTVGAGTFVPKFNRIKNGVTYGPVDGQQFTIPPYGSG